ncbi:MAG TPA: cation-translocating P-type ATPase [Aggregatilinea sp.]|uniref:cation-translocating P-type ATPase n=1 Tax=Aggregatilinea sp. TaxID=2806333 RepID=UPI002CD93406|nr:cation-translocating P-type ATPase [Aggregatilinea sp.]HML20157.1 cation-translocating P-type ATPase [Aggregatilinea sp.]
MATISTPWHTQPLEEVVQQLGSDVKHGLTDATAAERLQQYGPNALQEQPRPTFWQRLLAQFQSFVIYILIFAAVLSGLLGDWVEAAAIAAIVALNATLGVIQEGRAEEALAVLRKLTSPEALVIRGGHQRVMPASDLVPGDVVILEAGNHVPADVRLIETMNLKVDEASMTGESVPVDKRADSRVAVDAVLGDRRNMAYMSTTATYGRGKAIVVSTGMQTEIGKIADMIQSTEAETTPLQRRLDELGRTLSIGSLAICLLVGVVIFIREVTGGDFKFFDALTDSIMTAVALAIAAVPEGLPAVVTINLAIGMREMIRRNALIRRLPAVETLGSASTICSDKTGTLTQNEMTAVKLFVSNERLDVSGEGFSPVGTFSRDGQAVNIETDPEATRLLLAAMLASDAQLETNTDGKYGQNGYRMIGDPTEGAMVVAAAKAGLWRETSEQRYPRVNEIPFDSGRKRMSTIHQAPDGGPFVVFTKGAPEIVLEHCDAMLENGTLVPMTPERREAVLEANTQMAHQALRVLAVAQREIDALPAEITPENIEEKLTFLGLIAMIDPARPEVKPAIAKARHAGIRTVMVTGDYPDTARAIAREIGLLRENGRVIQGVELEAMSDGDLALAIEDVDVFARVSPEHKVRIVEAFRARDYVVAMTGDGVNDAPALKRASIGVAMGITGTDVSKETADMVLTDDNYVSIVSAVEQGRVIYANIRKFVYFLLSCNLAEIAVIFLATLAGAPSPLTPIQLLWLNLLTDGAPALALGVEKGDPDIMDRPPRPTKEPIINGDMRLGMLIQTIIITAATLATFMLGRHLQPDNWNLARTMAFVTLSSSELLRAYTTRSELNSLFKIGIFTNKYMQYAVSVSMVLLIAVLYVPFLRDIFDTVALSVVQWLYIIPAILAPSVAAELTKIYLRAQHAQQAALQAA